MSMSRGQFLRSLGFGAAGLVVGSEAWEQYARLTHVRKSFPSAGMPTRIVLAKPYGIHEPYGRPYIEQIVLAQATYNEMLADSLAGRRPWYWQRERTIVIDNKTPRNTYYEIWKYS